VNLRDTTRNRYSVSQVEQLTGYSVEVVEDPSLSATAVIHMASRRTVPAHLVRYNPATGQPPDYLICFRNQSAPSYALRTLPGEYSALNVVAIMYAAFQQFAPETDVGIDLAREYEMAQGMKG
jgi:hypothetical protein